MSDENDNEEEGGRSTGNSIEGHEVYHNDAAVYFYALIDGEIVQAASIEKLVDEITARQPRPR